MEQDNDNNQTIFQAVQRPASPSGIREHHSLWPSGPLTSLSRENKPELLEDIPKIIGGEALDCSSSTFDEVHTMVRSASDRSCCSQWKLPGKESCLGWVWKVTSLPRVPQHAPLSICALRIEDLPVDTITSRVSDFLRVNSIGCRYPSGATGRVDCCTSNCVKFVVQLWMSEDGEATILELQRRRGCSVLTKHIKDALFQSVRTGNPNIRYDRAIPHPSKQLQSKICKEMYTKDAEEHCSKRRRWSDGQLNCINLLESPSVDKNQLGIEGLWCMTKAKDDWSHFVARSLILNEGSVANRLRQSFLALFSAKFPCDEEDDMLQSMQSMHSNTQAISDDVSVVDKPPQEEAVDDTLLLALKTLVNCLESIETHQQDYLTNDSNKIKFHTPFWTRILKVLVFHLHQWSCYPQEAALSAKCLRILESLEPDGLSCFIEGAVVPLLPQVFEFGKAHHLALAEESEGLLKRCMEETSAKLMEAPKPPLPPKPPLAPSTCCSTRETSYREDTTIPEEECTTVAGTETQDQSTQYQQGVGSSTITTASHGFFLPLSSFHSV